MGKGIDQTRESAPEHAALLDDLKDQLLIVFLRRLGNEISIPVGEIDDTGNCLLAFSINNGVFNFKLEEKQ